MLTRRDDQASILDVAANAVGSLGSCRTEGIFLANARLHHRERERAAELLAVHQALLRSVEITTGSPGWQPTARGSRASPGRSTS